MNLNTILYLILALVVSATIAFFYYKNSKAGKLVYLFTVMRFLVLFLLGVLLINPKIKSTTYTVSKPDLVVLVDNSASMTTVDKAENINSKIALLTDNKKLQDKFTIEKFHFSNDIVKDSGQTKFTGDITDLFKALKATDNIYKNTDATVVLVSDGNQTYGSDYAYLAETLEHPVYSLIVGDTTQFEDIRISKVNVNKYAFYKNEFPVELFFNYSGQQNREVSYKLLAGNRTVYQGNLSFSPLELSKKVNLTLSADSKGVQEYTIVVSDLPQEKNTDNNTKQFGVEVIDEGTKIALVSSFSHPDIGAFKKSIESNQQRKVTIASPSEVLNNLNEYNLVILYQPNQTFSKVFEEVNKLGKNTFVVAGSRTDWDFLNNSQDNVLYHKTTQEEISPVYNSNFSSFLVNQLPFEDFPPLDGYLGNITINGTADILLNQKVKNISLNEPLLVMIENKGKRNGYLLGENSWRWRARSYVETGSFVTYDEFVSKLIFYLATSTKKERLQVNTESFYYGNVIIDAAYFDKNYQFNKNGNLELKLTDENGESNLYTMQLRNNYFQFNNSGLAPGKYTYEVNVTGENISKSGGFSVIGFDVEKQYYNANYKKMSKLSELTGGEVTLLEDTNQLIDNLINNQAFKPIQKSSETVDSIISWKLLLFLIVALLAAEWFLRKYNGLI